MRTESMTALSVLEGHTNSREAEKNYPWGGGLEVLGTAQWCAVTAVQLGAKKEKKNRLTELTASSRGELHPNAAMFGPEPHCDQLHVGVD